MKKFLSILLSLIMLLSISAGFNLTAYANEYSGTCGDNVNYNFNKQTGTLTISGKGDMVDYDSSFDTPWYIGEYSNDITKVDIQNGITHIGSFAFFECNMKNVVLPDSVKTIGKFAFYECEKLESISIPNQVSSIGNGAFNHCHNLKKITLPAKITKIAGNLFEYCYALSSINIPDGVKSIGYAAFRFSGLKSVAFPKSVTTIDDAAFLKTDITDIVIPASVKTIGSDVFTSCIKLNSITVESNNKNYSSQDGVLFNKDKTTLIQYPTAGKRTSYKVPNGVKIIGYWSFGLCKNIENITIPSSVKSVELSAFIDCTNIENVYYNSTVAQWNKISIEGSEYDFDNNYNYYLINATINCTDGVINGKSTTATSKPKAASFKKVTASKKSISFTWAKVKGVKGYQIQLATDKKFKKNKKTVTIKKQKTTKTTVKKLKAKKKYYVRIRTYKTVNGKKIYSSWSKVKSVKTK